MRKPNRLKQGDKVAFVSLSRGMLGEPQFRHKFDLARSRLEKLGLEVIAMPNALRDVDFLYRHPESRAQDLMDAFRDPEIKAVFNAIGGDDTIRLLAYVDFEVLRNNPKIFTGFSDTTVNHFMMHKAGLVSYYGLSVMNQLSEYVEINPYTGQSMLDTLFLPKAPLDIPAADFCSYDSDKIWWGEEHMGEATPRNPAGGYEILQGSGKVTGELLGGCVDVFPELLGTPLWPGLSDWEGKILLLESSENDMPADLLCWILRNLQAQGIFRVIRGIVVGRPAFQESEAEYREVYRKVVGFEAGRPDLPILFNANVGHAYPTGVLPLGLPYEIDCDAKTFTLLEPPTR